MPSVSVVVPTYNRADVLPRAIDSVLAQTFEDFELLVVDDASPDDTQSVATGYDDDRVRYVRHAENRGANHARNTGIEASTGEYVAFLDDDDAWVPSKLEKQLAVFRAAGSECGLVYAGSRFVEDGTVVSENRPTKTGWLYRDLLRENFIPSASPVVRRACFDDVGPFDTDLESGQDWDMWLRISRAYRIGVVPESLTTTYREARGRISDNPGRVYRGRAQILEKYYDDIREDPIALARLHYKLGITRLAMGEGASSWHFRQSLRSNPRNVRTLALFLVSLFPQRKFIFERLRQLA